MPKTILLADLHLGKFWKSNNSAFSRARKLISSMRQNLLEMATPEDHLIILGDVFDSVHANTEMLIYIKKQLFDILEGFPNLTIIAGNHETFIDKDGKQQTLLDLCSPFNGKVYNTGIHKSIINGINYILIPHQQNLDDWFKQLVDNQDQYFENNIPNILLAHMTPSEIFSYEKFSMNEIIDHIRYELPYIILGHYHKPKDYKHNKTKVISVGNSYYTTIDDVRDYKKAQKRYLVIDGRKIKSVHYNLPNVIEYQVENQVEFDNLIPEIEEKYTSDDIIYLKSKVLIDYSILTIAGYDIYFDLIEDTDSTISLLVESNINSTDAPTGNTLNERWEKYIELTNMTTTQKNLANWLFSKREDSDINIDTILNLRRSINFNE